MVLHIFQGNANLILSVCFFFFLICSYIFFVVALECVDRQRRKGLNFIQLRAPQNSIEVLRKLYIVKVQSFQFVSHTARRRQLLSEVPERCQSSMDVVFGMPMWWKRETCREILIGGKAVGGGGTGHRA